MSPVASIEVTNVLDTTETKDMSNVSRKNTGAYSGTVFNQICSTMSASNNNGRAKNQVRKKEYFFSHVCDLDFDKPRKKIMREVLAKETYAYIVENDETRFDLVADEEKRKKITEAMMHSARMCAEEMFYRNEVFKTKIKTE